MSNGKFKLAQLQLGRIYLMGPGYIQSIVGDTVLEPDEARINLGGSDMFDRGSCHGSGTQWRPDESG
jgi:hypothetical protein